MNIQDIIKQNPVLSDPNLTDKLKRWERIRDAVETAYPEATPEHQASIIGEVIEHLEAGEPPPLGTLPEKYRFDDACGHVSELSEKHRGYLFIGTYFNFDIQPRNRLAIKCRKVEAEKARRELIQDLEGGES